MYSNNLLSFTFAAWVEGRYISLAEVVRALGDTVAKCTWRIEVEELAPHPASRTLEELCAATTLATHELVSSFSDPVQIIDGRALAFADLSCEHELIAIVALRSSHWDIHTRSSKLVEAIRLAFPAIKPFPSTEAPHFQ